MTSRGKTTWSKRSIETILTNEKYVGDVILYKTFSPNFPEKKRIPNNGEHQKYIQEDHHYIIQNTLSQRCFLIPKNTKKCQR